MKKRDVVFYEEGSLSIVDTLDGDTGLSTCMHESLEQIRKRYPKARIVAFDTALEQIREKEKEVYPMLQPVEITDDQWNEMFELLPPMQYKRTEAGTSFKMSEMTKGDITAGYVMKGGKYYTMNCRVKTTHEEMLGVII